MSEFLNLPRGIVKRILLLLLAPAYVWVGITHFTGPEFFVAIVPPYLPEPLLLVYISGVAEILGGLGVIPFATRKWAGWGLIALLIAVFPANIHMAMNPEQFPEASETALYVRLAIQFLLAAWAWWATQPDAEATV
jgi:uncharacterized membrane protein